MKFKQKIANIATTQKAKFISLLILLIIFFLGGNNLSLEAEETPREKAESCMDFLNYEEAVHYYTQAIEDNPDQKDLRVSQGYAYFRLGKYEDAVKVLKEELALFPDNLNAFILLSYVYFNKEKLKEAENICQEFSTILKKAVREEAKKKGLDFSRQEDRKEFESNYEYFVDKVRNNNPNFSLPYFILGFYHKKSRNFEKAAENFNLAIQRGYNPVECTVQLIDIELIREEWQEALTKSQNTIQTEGSKSKFYFLMGYAYYHLGEIEKALYCFENAFKLKPHIVETTKNLAKIYYNQEEFKKATNLLKKILSLVPYDYEAKFLLERASREKSVQRKENKPKLTKDIVNKVNLEYKYVFHTDINRVINIMNESALTLVRSGQLSKATKLIRNFIEINDLSPDLNYNLAHFYNMQNDLGKALKYAWRATELRKNLRDAFDLVGNIFFKIQDYQSSLQAYRKVINIDPRDAMGYYNLGCVYYAMEDFDEAEKRWKDAIRFEKGIKKIKEKDKISDDELDISLIVFKPAVSLKAHKSLARFYLNQNLMEKALEHFKKTIELAPADPEPYYELGKIYQVKKDINNAIYYFEKYLYLGRKKEIEVKELLKTLKEKKEDGHSKF